jgi:hypothetical protein
MKSARHFPSQLMRSEKFFGRFFEGESWASWRVVLAVLSGLPLTETEQQLFTRCTGRNYAPTVTAWSIFRELWLVIGRGGGKSLISALLVVGLVIRAIVERMTARLAPGEKLTVMSISAELRQTRVVLGYIKGFIAAVPLLRSRVVRETQNSIEFRDGIVIEGHTASFRSTRGYSLLGVVCDELAYFRSDENAANRDEEILNAIRPGLARVPGSLLICISSPWGRKGSLWKAYDKYFGKENERVLVWQADSLTMNPTLDEAAIQAAYEEDEAVASAEWGAQFRRDIEAFVSREVLDACTMRGRFELPAMERTPYVAFVDPSGGSADSMTLAIAHAEKPQSLGASVRVVLDLVREKRPPFSPSAAVLEFIEVLREYRVRRVCGDRYAGEWPREQFRRYGIEYVCAEKTKSDLYRDVLPLLNSGRAELLDEKRLLQQLLGLERRTARGGKDSIDHAPRSHDDVANAVAGALVIALESSQVRRGVGQLAGGEQRLALENRLKLARLIEERRD